MKLNLGCGYNKLDGFTNVDSQESCEPDILVDLEELPWPFESDSADEIVLCHVLEHLGETSAIYLKIIQELYRVSQHSARISITVPHPRPDDFTNHPSITSDYYLVGDHISPLYRSSYTEIFWDTVSGSFQN